MKVSIIIPVLNEEKMLVDCLNQFKKFKDQAFEIIVCDGGSTDQTLSILNKRSDVIVCSSAAGRGLQLNKGASMASGEILLFLHADSFLPENWYNSIINALADEAVVGGFFKNQMFGQEADSLVFRIGAYLLTVRSCLTKKPYGDMGIFVRASVFKKLKGYLNIAIMEDYEFSRRLVKMGKVVRLSYILKTSIRRFKGNLLWTVFLMFLLRIGFNLKINPAVLAKFYKQIR